MTTVVATRPVLVGMAAVAIAACSSPGAPRVADPTIVLGSHGLGPVPFGDSKAQATAELTRLLGPPSGQGPNTGCGTAFTEVDWGELAVEFHQDTFTGYRDINRPDGNLQFTVDNIADPVRPAAKTAAGVALGDSLGQLRAAYSRLSLVGANRWRAGNGLSFIDDSSHSPGAPDARIVEIRVGTCGSY